MQLQSVTAVLVSLLAVANAAGHKDDKVTLYSWRNRQCSGPPSQDTLKYRTCKGLSTKSKSLVFPSDRRSIPKNCVVNGYASDTCTGDILIQIKAADVKNNTCFQLPGPVDSVEFTC